MTEYWKSQARKYCEFCKCWFADNKVSISFHENGKRHKENVKKHISQLSKKSTKEFKQKEKLDDDMKKMESAAMAAYLKDVQNNADLTSQSINNIISESGSSVATVVAGDESKTKEKSSFTWHEVKNENGSSYFWNTISNETTWDPPGEYLSVADQEKNKSKEAKKAEKRGEKERDNKQKEALKEAKAYLAREKMKELSVQKEQPAVKSTPTFGPVPRAVKPYGSWKPIVAEEEVKVDMQLPKPDKELPPPPVVMEPERVIQFKERRVDSLGEGPVEFKKRKFNNPKRNIRQKMDDD